jgi:hypothetical protein
MKGKYLTLFPLTSLSKFPKHYLEIIGKKKIHKKKVEINWVTGWIIIDKYLEKL